MSATIGTLKLSNTGPGQYLEWPETSSSICIGSEIHAAPRWVYRVRSWPPYSWKHVALVSVSGRISTSNTTMKGAVEFRNLPDRKLDTSEPVSHQDVGECKVDTKLVPCRYSLCLSLHTPLCFIRLDHRCLRPMFSVLLQLTWVNKP